MFPGSYSKIYRNTGGIHENQSNSAATRQQPGVFAIALTLTTSLILPLDGRTGNTPTIKLFPTTVLEEIKHTGQVASEMETGLQSTTSKLDQQQQLYLDSKCEGNNGDQGCDLMAKQLGNTYLEMLNIMANKLPEMESAVNATSASLEKRLRKELGHKKTAWSLHEMLLGDMQHQSGKGKSSMRGRSGMRLSSRFKQYYKLVSRPGSTSNSSLAVVASDIYLDMQETSQLIARTQDEIARATLMQQLNQSLGVITPEMQEVVSGVKDILFGEEDASPMAASRLARPAESYTSPLQL